MPFGNCGRRENRAERSENRRFCNPFGIHFRNFRKALLLLLLAFGLAIAVDCASAANVDTPSSVTNTLSAPAVGTDLLQFLDGSSLHGKLRSVDVERGIQWQHPGAKQLIEFTPTNIASIAFENTRKAWSWKPGLAEN
jgi:hypothetical protein